MNSPPRWPTGGGVVGSSWIKIPLIAMTAKRTSETPTMTKYMTMSEMRSASLAPCASHPSQIHVKK